MSSFGGSPTGAAGPTGRMLDAMADVAETRATFLNRLENALSRLKDNTDRTVQIAQALTGGWPTQGAAGKENTASAGVFGAVEDIAYAIHRACDRLDEANSAVSERLP